MELYLVGAVLAVLLLIVILLLMRRGKDTGTQAQLEQTTAALNARLDTVSRSMGDEFARCRNESAEGMREQLRLLSEQQRQLLQTLSVHQKELGRLEQENQEKTNAILKEMYSVNLRQNEKLHEILSEQSRLLNQTLTEVVGKLQESNEKKLDEMRATVDEKLTSTLTQRLDSSFKTVGDQLKQVYHSLGEMKELASGVSDLQRVLTNVKARGTWAEVQLGNILEQTLTADQYERNVSIKNNGEMVEFAVKIPSRDDDGSIVWLPIDSKFPQEDYLRISDAADRADKAALDEAAKALERTIKNEAATISKLYIDVPRTTDFAILFLATEGLYAEVLRRPGLTEELQNKYRVMVCGPTTITAFLNTLRMGFRTIALDKRAAEVWKVLGAAKTQYETFETVLGKVRKKLDEAGNTLDEAQRRNNIIRKNLRKVEQLEAEESDALLGLTDGSVDLQPVD